MILFGLLLGIVFHSASALTQKPAERPPLAGPPAQPVWDAEPAQSLQVTEGNTAFALDLYARLSSEEGNVFFSPYSISTALAMTYAGARGDTKAQMMETLHFFEPDERFHELFGALEKGLNEQGQKGDYQLAVANALWIQKEFTFLDAFLDLTKANYSAGMEKVDYRQNADDARQVINGWVEKKTNDKIKDLIPRGVLDALTRLVLTNAIYFKGDWAVQFDREKTQEDFFITSRSAAGEDSAEVEYNKTAVQMMFQKGDFLYGENDVCQSLRLPYKGGDLSMVILLPVEKDTAALEKHLSAQTLRDWTAGLHELEVEIFLPRFTMTYRCELSGILAEMGMPQAVSMGADFSGMTGSRDLFISNVIHKAFVEVNEEGTEAAAATGVVMKLTSAPHARPVFRADHPFIFLIKDNATDSILFMGRVTDPTQD